MAREGLMDDCGYNFDVDEDSYNSGLKDGFLIAIDRFAEEVKWLAENKWIYDLCKDKDCIEFAKSIDEIAEQLKGE